MKDLVALIQANVWVKTGFGVLTSVAGFFFDSLLIQVFLILIILTLIDCSLGYIRAFSNKKAVVSRVMIRYAWKFVGYMIAASTLFLMSNAMPENIQVITGWLDNFALAFFVVHEAISIIEHLNEMGVPLPTNLLNNMRKVKEAVDSDDVSKYKEKPEYRITTTLPCPQCGKDTEQYDASSSLIWDWHCENCGWKDTRQYYETGEHEISLLTPTDAEILGFCESCGMHQTAVTTSIDWKKYWEAVAKYKKEALSEEAKPTTDTP